MPAPGKNKSNFPYLIVNVQEWMTQPDGTRWAQCTDQLGHAQTVPLAPILGGGALPQPGEVWSIERVGSEQWTFRARWGAVPPVISVSRTGASALDLALLAALVQLGIVVDQTTS